MKPLVHVVAASLIGLTVALVLLLATRPQPTQHPTAAECWMVRDQSGHVMYLTTPPQFDSRFGAVTYTQGRYTGYLWPAQVEIDTVCVEKSGS